MPKGSQSRVSEIKINSRRVLTSNFLYRLKKRLIMSEENEELPDSKIPWWDNHYEDVYSEEVEDGYPYDMGTKVQE